MPRGVFLHCELCDGGDGVVVTVLSQTLGLEVCHGQGVSPDPEGGRGDKGGEQEEGREEEGRQGEQEQGRRDKGGGAGEGEQEEGRRDKGAGQGRD